MSFISEKMKQQSGGLEDYNKRLVFLGRAGDLASVERVFKEMELKDRQPDLQAYSAVISAYGKCHMVQKAEKWYRRMKAMGVEPDVATYNTMIGVYGRQGLVEKAEGVREDMEGKQNSETYRILMDMYTGERMLRGVEQLWEDMEKNGERPKVHSFNSLIDAYGKARMVKKAEEVWGKMSRFRVEPNEKTFCTLLHAYGRSNMVEKAERLWEEMGARGLTQAVVPYGMIMHMYCKNGHHEKVLQMCAEMEERGVRKNEFIYTILINSHGSLGDVKGAERAFQQFLSSEGCDNLYTWNSMIDLLGKRWRTEEALNLFAEMKGRGLRPDEVIFSTVIDACAKVGMFQEAEKLFGEMVHLKLKPTAVVLSTVVFNYGKYNEPLKAREWFHRITEAGVSPNTECFNALMSSQLKAERYSEARQVFEDMKQRGVKPDLSTYTLLLSSLMDCSERHGCEVLLQLMGECGQKAHEVLWVVSQSERERAWGKVGRILQGLVGEKLEGRKAFVNVLIRFLSRFGLQRRAAELWDMVRSNWRRAVPVEGSKTWTLDLHGMNEVSARIVLCAELMRLRSFMNSQGKDTVPVTARIISGWGKRSKVSGRSSLKLFTKEFLSGMGSPFEEDEAGGCFHCQGRELRVWLLSKKAKENLGLHDCK